MAAWSFEIYLQRVLKNVSQLSAIFQHSKRNFVSQRGYEISSNDTIPFKYIKKLRCTFTISQIMCSHFKT